MFVSIYHMTLELLEITFWVLGICHIYATLL